MEDLEESERKYEMARQCVIKFVPPEDIYEFCTMFMFFHAAKETYGRLVFEMDFFSEFVNTLNNIMTDNIENIRKN